MHVWTLPNLVLALEHDLGLMEQVYVHVVYIVISQDYRRIHVIIVVSCDIHVFIHTKRYL